ncbi:hypothetical protein AAD018_011400 [Aestuariibius insulae]|uniref:hypothetical protein n=1 Tax=Aestuariibius insulae TaxID=2058287 RepID=UPI00398E5348
MIKKAVDLREEGMTYAAIGKQLGMPRASVRYHCLRLGAEPPSPYRIAVRGPMVVRRGNHVIRRFSEADDRRLINMRTQGATLTAIADALDRNVSSILGRLMTLARHEDQAERARIAEFHQ